MSLCVLDFHYFPKSEETSNLGFRTYLELARFTHRQLSEIYRTSDIGTSADWANLHLLNSEVLEMKELNTFLTASRIRQSFITCKLTGIQSNVCLKAMQTFYKYFCAKLLSHTASQSPLMRGVVCFDPKVLKGDPDVTGKPAFDTMVSTMLKYNWVEASEAALARDEYDSLVVDLQADRREITAEFFSETHYMEERPNLYKTYKLASLCIGYGPRNITPFERPFKVHQVDEVPTNSLLRCLQTSTYLREFSPTLYCERHNLQAMWQIRDQQASQFSNLGYKLRPWSTLEGTNKTFIKDTLESAYAENMNGKTKGLETSPVRIRGNSVVSSPRAGSPGPSRASPSTQLSESAFLRIPRKTPLSSRKVVTPVKDVSTPESGKSKGKSTAEPEVSEKRESERVKNKERKEDK